MNLTSKLNSKNCPVCKSENIFFHSTYRNKNQAFDNLKKFICRDCNLVFSFPMPSQNKLDSYNMGYHKNAHGGHNRNPKLEAFFRGIAKTRLNTLVEKTGITSSDKYSILEIGPGPGVFAQQWKSQFPYSEYYAIETDTSLHDTLKKMGIKLLNNNNLSKFNSFFDFVIISHVLEHVVDPKSFLEPYIKTLKKDSILFIEVPCMDFEHKSIDEPHLLFFDKKSIGRLFENLELKNVFTGYFGIKIKQLKNPLFKIYNQIMEKLYYRGISFFNLKKGSLYKILGSKTETNSVINFYPHIEQKVPAWWIRAIVKK